MDLKLLLDRLHEVLVILLLVSTPVIRVTCFSRCISVTGLFSHKVKSAMGLVAHQACAYLRLLQHEAARSISIPPWMRC